MKKREWQRLEAIGRVTRGEWSGVNAANALGLSERQLRRLRRRVERDGEAGVVHGNVDREPANKTPGVITSKVLKLARGKYAGFNDTHLTEKLLEEGIEVSRETIRVVLRKAGIGAAKKRRPTKFRRRREREAQAGRMILWDGSRHDWLEERGPIMCLVGAVDDATGELLPGAHFLEHESSAAYLTVLKAVVAQKGTPWMVYQDRHGSLKQNHRGISFDEELAGRREKTQVGRALDDLGIRAIFALSPQAKGRVERLWGTLQDRLVSELRLANARTIDEANATLEKYRPQFNRRFAHSARDAEPAWRPKVEAQQLERICSFLYEVLVHNDNTVRWNRQVLDVPPGVERKSWAGKRIELRHGLDGSVRLWAGDELLLHREHVTGPLPATMHAPRPRQFGTNRPNRKTGTSPPTVERAGGFRRPYRSFAETVSSVRSHKQSTGSPTPPGPPSKTATTAATT